MKFISHRGNLNGRYVELENKPEYILRALDQDYECEVDIWYIDKQLLLGHDKPEFKIDEKFCNLKNIWFHAKNISCLEILNNFDCNFFWHEDDQLTLTSKKWIWFHPKNLYNPIKSFEKSIIVLPELNQSKWSEFGGLCSDYPEKYKTEYHEKN